MMEALATRAPAAPCAADSGRSIDLVHLARMTLGDRSLEREVLQLFTRQAGQFMQRLQAASPEQAQQLAHTLKGSARGIGAWRVAAAADTVEAAACDPQARADAVARLGAAVDEACAIVADLLRAN
jgi:HPt (histidine-containing phosphotransfer) domain-containing protein